MRVAVLFGTESESSESDFKLADCGEVAFDMRDGTAGVIYCKGGNEGWAPVTKRRSKSRRKYVRGNSDDDELVLPDGASISYVNLLEPLVYLFILVTLVLGNLLLREPGTN